MSEAKSFPSEDRVQKFKFLLERFSEWAKNEGAAVEPFQAGGPHWFQQMPPPNQIATLTRFHHYFQAAQETIEGGDSMRQDAQFLWRMFKKLGVHPLPDFMDHLSKGEVIEVYNAEFVQVFRNLEFFRICSYTLDEVLCRPFWDLYQRDEKMTQEIVETLQSVFQEKIPGTVLWNKQQHAVNEICSFSRYSSVINLKKLSPLFGPSGKVEAVVSTLEVVSCVPTASPVLEPVGTEVEDT